MHPTIISTANTAWLSALLDLTGPRANLVSPRGRPTLELPHRMAACHIDTPLVTVSARKLSYSFAAAEALAMLAGDDRVEVLAPYAPQVAQFSDDGIRFAGAYGPRIVTQLNYVIMKLIEDRNTRQAVISIWTPNPKPSKDIPCTLALTFSIRNGVLNVHAFMRSSDAWLGLPYDLFNFAMIGVFITCAYNRRVDEEDRLQLGTLYLTAASAHLYKDNYEQALGIIETWRPITSSPLPAELIREGRWDLIEASLIACRDRTEAVASTAVWRIRP
jgi:hypothetical protein